MSTLSNSDDISKDFEPRFKLLYLVVILSSVIVLTRLWYLQIIKGDELKAYSEKNRVKETKVPAPRGLVLDRNGEVLVDNLPGFEATITPQYATELEETAHVISDVLNVPEADILAMVKKSKRENGTFMPVKIKENLSLDEVFRIKMLTLYHPGLAINETILRHYPLNENGAQLFGYVGEITKKQLKHYKDKHPDISFEQGDIIGKRGLEEVWESTIRGTNGLNFNEVDARGRGKKQAPNNLLGFKQKPAVAGNNIVLTIDKDVQQAAYKAMQRDDKLGTRIGALVAIKSNGEVVAWVNSPSFDPNQFSTGISNKLWTDLINDPFKPLRNKVIQDHYPPGSTFKPIMALAALQEGVIKDSTVVYAPGQIKFGRKVYHDHTRYGHGNITVYEAIEKSSNVFFYKLGIQLGIDKMAHYSRLLGFGSKTGINMEDERTGLMPDREWKLKRFGEPWQPGENLSNAIGQGFVLTTPLQMAVAYNAIGMEGQIYKPFLVKKIIDSKNNVISEFKPKLVRDVSIPPPEDYNNENGAGYISTKNFRIVKEAMRRVANGAHGTARWYKVPGIEMAGKTGTVQVQSFSADQIYEDCDKRPLIQRHHGWYGTFAPVEKPEITVVILAEHACHGSSGGAPVARDVIQAYMQKYHPEWLKRKKDKVIAKKATPATQPSTESISE